MALRWALGTMRKQTHTQLQNGERMNGSTLTEGQIDYICRYALTPILEEAERTKRSSKMYNPSIIYANATIEKIGELFRAMGYWQEENGSTK